MRTFNYSALRKQKWDSEILGLVAAIYKEAGKQELYLKQRPAELEKLVEIAKVQSTEASNAIEGIVTTNTRIRQLVKEKTTPRNRDEQEIAGYRDVLSLIHENFNSIPITQNYILQLHKILCSHINNPMAGRTKSVQNYISATYPDGHVETLFTPLAPYETPEALDRICEEYNRVIGNMEVEPLIVIPVFIHDFLCIHPFNDGNGRMSRLLTTLLLYLNGFYVGKYISLEAKIAKARSSITMSLAGHRSDGMKAPKMLCRSSNICLGLFFPLTRTLKTALLWWRPSSPLWRPCAGLPGRRSDGLRSRTSRNFALRSASVPSRERCGNWWHPAN